MERMPQLSNGNPELSAEGHGSLPNGRSPAAVAPEGMGAQLAGPGATNGERAPALLTDFEQIYQGGAAKPPRLAYGVLKVRTC